MSVRRYKNVLRFFSGIGLWSLFMSCKVLASPFAERRHTGSARALFERSWEW